jgi:hypothetical protein
MIWFQRHCLYMYRASMQVTRVKFLMAAATCAPWCYPVGLKRRRITRPSPRLDLFKRPCITQASGAASIHVPHPSLLGMFWTCPGTCPTSAP